MNPEPTNPSSLRIGRLQLNCLVPSDHPSPEQVRTRLTEATEKLLPTTLASALDRAFPETDPSLWFIRQLNLAADLNVAWDRERLTQSLAVCTAQSLCEALGSVGGGANVVRFNSPAEYLATFLTDLAQGHAWGNWYYNRFDGLRMLPTSAALRTAICDDLSASISALHKATLAILQKIIIELTESDTARILKELAPEAPTGPEEECYPLIVGAIGRLTMPTLSRLSQMKAALLLFVEATRASDDPNNSQIALAAQVLAGLIQCLRNMPASEQRRLLATLSTGDTASLYQSVGPALAEQLVPLLRLSDPSLKQIFAVVVDEAAITTNDEGVSAGVRTTAFGGAFFLLPLINELPLAAAAHGLPAADGVTPEAMIRWALLVKCFGQTNSKAIARDSFIQELAGLPPLFLSREVLIRWQRKLTVKQIKGFLAQVVRWRWQNQTVGGQVCILATVHTNGRRLAIMIDASRGCWLFSVVLSGNEDKSLGRVFGQLPFIPEVVLCDRHYQPLLQSLLPHTRVIDLKDGPMIDKSVPTELIGPISAELPRIFEQISYFTLPVEFGLSSRLDQVLCVVAQGLLRDFAWRLPGFAWSQPAHLVENFLNCSATVEEETERRVVKLGRPPLDLLLNMTGLNRRQYELSWLEGQRFELYPEHM